MTTIETETRPLRHISFFHGIPMRYGNLTGHECDATFWHDKATRLAMVVFDQWLEPYHMARTYLFDLLVDKFYEGVDLEPLPGNITIEVARYKLTDQEARHYILPAIDNYGSLPKLDVRREGVPYEMSIN